MALVIINPDARSIDDFRLIRRELRARPHHTVRESREPGDGALWVRRALDQMPSHERIEVAVMGGDGTINRIVNGVAGDLDRIQLAILPAGTGNDLARSLGIPLDARESFELLEDGGATRPVDVMEVTAGEHTRLGLNALHGGYDGEIAGEVTDEHKEQFSPFAYLAAGSEGLGEREDYETIVRWGDGQLDRLQAVEVLVTNGGSIGGGFSVAPDVELTDGCLDVYLLRSGTLLNLADIAPRMATGRLAQSSQVVHRVVSSFELESQPPMAYSLDGVPLTKGPEWAVSLQEHALLVLTPPDVSN